MPNTSLPSTRLSARLPYLVAGTASALLLATACSAAPGEAAASPAPTAKATAARAKLPAEVAAFKARRDQCDHFRGEDPGENEARARQLEQKLTRFCAGTDAQLRTLRKRYAANRPVTAALAGYEDAVE